MLKRISIVIVLAIILITSCKKYPDGPLINFHSKEKRIVGEWSVDYFSIDGVDSTGYLQAQPYYGKYGISNEIDQGQKGLVFFSKDYPTPNLNPNYTCMGYWKFVNKKRSIYMHFRIYSAQGECGPFRANEITWDIYRLTDDDLWLKTNYNGKEYFVKFKH